MLVFGPVSSIFDFLTYGILLYLGAPKDLFHTVWFLESLTTQILVIHVIRTTKIPFLESKPSRFLVLTSVMIAAAAVGLVFSPLRSVFGFVVPPGYYLAIIAGIVVVYLAMAQWVKQWFVRKHGDE
jgi:Mg2+-importing ATPase